MTRESLLNSTLFEFYAASISDSAQVEKLIGTSSYLLRELNNPHNIEVLTTNICASPIIWSNPDVLFTSKKLLECYLAAARRVIKYRAEEREDADDGQPQVPRLHIDAWLTAIERGLGLKDGVPRRPGPLKLEWKASLIMAGITYGLSVDTRKDSSPDLAPLAQPLVDRLSIWAVELANVVITSPAEYPPAAVQACIIALAVLPLQYIHVGLPIRTEFALPILEAMLGRDGLRDGEVFIPPGDAFAGPGSLISWPASSPGFTAWKGQWGRPVLSLLSQLLWLEVELAKHAPWSELGRFVQAIERMVRFSEGVRRYWEQSVFKEVELTQPGRYLTPDTYENSWKLLDGQLSKLAVAIVAPLKEITGRLLAHRGYLTPDIARQCLLILNNLSFATQGRITSSAFYSFTLAAAVDVLSTSAPHCNQLLQELAPLTQFPLTRMQRVHALFFFTVAESLGSRLPHGVDTTLISQPAMFYVTQEAGAYLHAPDTQTSGIELWESAHVAILALVANTHLAPIDMVEPYLLTLIENYPSLINLTQLVVGFRTLVQVSSPPYALSASFPGLPSVLMEVVHHHALTAPVAQTGYVLAMVEALPFIPHDVLPEWLDVVYHLTGRVTDPMQSRTLDGAFRNTLSQMDPTRSIICCDWWTTGSRPAMVRNNPPGPPGATDLTMSGALGEPSRL
ncbi:peroxisomal membrane protein Pex17 [Zalerion maritima]|uniref:Peroxisomal membrane protein Pex17 n=1 Tax=Zalerion maritima TaxID=339359 RepID=A0AAD5S0A5_9PEZI|nr:peroxisomal membrane protein Pex17 [Zalerion maritima]